MLSIFQLFHTIKEEERIFSELRPSIIIFKEKQPDNYPQKRKSCSRLFGISSEIEHYKSRESVEHLTIQQQKARRREEVKIPPIRTNLMKGELAIATQ